MNDQGPTRPNLPYDELHAALESDPESRARLDALRAHLDDPAAHPDTVAGHVDALRGVRDIEARIANWWDDPNTQIWIKGLTDAGL
jgi:hypothetical protein